MNAEYCSCKKLFAATFLAVLPAVQYSSARPGRNWVAIGFSGLWCAGSYGQSGVGCCNEEGARREGPGRPHPPAAQPEEGQQGSRQAEERLGSTLSGTDSVHLRSPEAVRPIACLLLSRPRPCATWSTANSPARRLRHVIHVRIF